MEFSVNELDCCNIITENEQNPGVFDCFLFDETRTGNGHFLRSISLTPLYVEKQFRVLSIRLAFF